MLQFVFRSNFLRHSMLSPKMLRCYSTSSDFETAQSNLKILPEEPDTETKLKLYGLYKQAMSGDVSDNRPGAFDFAGRAKFDAWKSSAGISKEDAQKQYVELVNSLLKSANVSANNSSNAAADASGTAGVDVTQTGKVFKITLNRPDKFNALTWDMYDAYSTALETASKDRSTSVTVITGTDPYYCSGNDLRNFTQIKTPDDMKDLADRGEKVLERFVNAHIVHEKPLIALINGPAIGISVTVLGLVDCVIASDKATFQTPFSSLGQSPEGCSSYTFPLLMGTSKASEVLLFGRKLTAQEAFERNLVAQVIPDAQFLTETEKIVSNYAQLPPESLRLNKQLVRSVHKERLLKANVDECAFLKKRWLSAECHQALAKFMSRKK